MRIGVLLSRAALPAWHARCLQQLVAEPGVTVAAVMRRDPPETGASRRRPGRDRALVRSRWPAAERPVGEVTSHVPQTTLLGTLDRLRDYRLDVLLVLGPCNDPTRFAGAVAHGVWLFDFELREAESGAPAAFWEVHDGIRTTGAALLEIPRDGTTRRALRDGNWPSDLRSVGANRQRLLSNVTDWPAWACRMLQRGEPPPHASLLPMPSPPGRRARPRRRDILRLAVRLTGRRLRSAARHLFRHAQWNVGIADAPIAAFLERGSDIPIQWFPSTRRRFYADPFGVWLDGRLTVLCEEYRYGSRGRIAYVHAAGNDFSGSMAPAIDEPFHLSYPYLVHHRGALHCIPEASRTRQVVLYRADPFPIAWHREAVLVQDDAVVDPTVFQHAGRWWLTGTDADRGANSHLCVWYADHLLGPWTPHPLNPVKIDSSSARPGGTPFIHHHQLYRPAQDCSAQYGGRIILNRVVRLTPTQFHEEPARSIDPFAGEPFADGVHTLSAAGSVTLVDGLTHVYSPAAMWGFLRVMWRNAVSRRASES